MPRGGDSGLRQHRRQLLFEFSECLKTVTEVRNPTHLQLQAHHACHQVIAHATSLKGSIWDYTSSRSLGVDAGVEAWLVDRILSRDLSVPVPPVHSPVAANSGSSTAARPTQRSRSPRPSSSTHPPQVVGGATLIQASGPREAADDLLQVFGIQGGQSEQIALALLDFHGVIDLDWEESCSLIGTLSREGIYIGCLSFCRDPSTISHVHQYGDQLAQEVQVTIPIIITPRRVIRECRSQTDWCKSEFLDQLPVGRKFWVCFIDDKWEIISDCRRVLGDSQFVRLIHCNRGLRHAIEQWEGPVKGSHQLVIGSEFTLRIVQ